MTAFAHAGLDWREYVRVDPRSVTLWGTGTPRREFLHVDDLGRACLVLLEKYDDDMPINVGTGEDVTIRELAELVASVVGFDGAIEWDTSTPDGTLRKLLDVSRVHAVGWKADVVLVEGVAGVYHPRLSEGA